MPDMQKAAPWKRIAAAVLDLIIVTVLATGFGWIASLLTSYDSLSARLETFRTQYETTYHTSLSYTAEEYARLGEEEQQAYDAAAQAFQADQAAGDLYVRLVWTSLFITTAGLFFAFLFSDFLIPLWLRDGRTVGKLVFSLCLVREDCVRVSPVQLFIRAMPGKFALETMIPVCLFLMFALGSGSLWAALIVSLLLLLLQAALFFLHRRGQVIHDLMAGTVCCDRESQRIFGSAEALQAYINSSDPQDPASQLITSFRERET